MRGQSAEGYGRRGVPVDPESEECLAKAAPRRWWVRRMRTGPSAGRLYDPLDPQRGEHELMPASQESFDSYVAYLRTGNPTHLRVSERVV